MALEPTILRLTILGSGSGGNTLLVEAGGSRILIDGGLRPRKLRERLRAAHHGLPGDDAAPPATAAFLTHEHTDHVCGTEALASHGVRLFATAGTARALTPLAQRSLTELGVGEALSYEAFVIHPIALPHDADEPVAYVIESEGTRLGVLTDCGHPSPAVLAGLRGCDALVLEANHDAGMLMEGPYPTWLKRRIAADTGHLSNEQSAQILRALLKEGPAPALVIAAHLSRTNNRQALVEIALRRALGTRRDAARLLITPPDGALPPQELGRARHAAQLGFGFP